MAVTANTAISLSENYYLRNFYQSNRDAATGSMRKELSNSSLSSADAKALRAAIRKLGNFNYQTDSSDQENITSSVSAFLKTYNYALSSSSASSDHSLNRYAKQLKNLSKEYTKELKALGITVSSDGTLEKNDNLLKKANLEDLEKVFGSNASFVTKSARYAKRIDAISSDLLYAEQAQIGSNINLTI